MGHFKLLSPHVGEYTAPLDYSFSENIQVNAELAVTSKRVKTLSVGLLFLVVSTLGFFLAQCYSENKERSSC